MKTLGQVRHGLESMNGATLLPSEGILGVSRGYHIHIGQLVVAGVPNPRRLGVISSLAVDLNTPFSAVTCLGEAQSANDNSVGLEGHRLVLIGAETPGHDARRLVVALNHLPNLLSFVTFQID